MSASDLTFDWVPPRELVEGSNLSRFIRKTGHTTLKES